MSRSDRTSLYAHNLGFLFTGCSLLWLDLRRKRLRNLFTQIDSQEALGQFDSVELGSQRLKNLLPLDVRRQTSARSAANAMFAVQLNVQRVESVATR